MGLNRVGQVLLVPAVALLFGSCATAQQTVPRTDPPASQVGSPLATAAGTPQATPEPAQSAAPGPTLSSADAVLVDRAIGLIGALGGSTSADAAVSVRSSGPDSEPGTWVSVGDWVVRWDAAGRLVNVIHPPPHAAPAPGAALSEAEVRLRAADYLAGLGIALGAPDSIAYQTAGPYWEALWNRVVGGVPVPSDGTKVVIGPDGAFVSYFFAETPVAPAPAITISQAAALAKAPFCRNSSGGPNGLVETCAARLEWHAPALTPGARLQLCWRIEYTRKDNDESRASLLWLDAGTGETVDGAATM